VAFRAFKEANSDCSVSQTYFYTLFAKFGNREKKKDDVLKIISSGVYKNCMRAYHKYKSQNTSPVSYVYFLKVWKKHFNIIAPVKNKKTIDIAGMTAKAILKKVTELTKHEIVDLKDKQEIVKEACTLLTNAGYEVIQ
jgi:hypothetical protein